jgi:hypothetical protein
MKALGGSGYKDPRFPDLGTSWSSASRPGCLTTGTHYIGSWFGDRSGRREEEKIFDHTVTRTPTPQSCSP